MKTVMLESFYEIYESGLSYGVEIVNRVQKSFNNHKNYQT
jgi:hypothetical protein